MHTANEVLDGLTPEQFRRFWTKVDRIDGGCWEWRGAIHPNGYGTWTVARADKRTTSVRPHRVAWYNIRGPIPDGLVLDHACRNRTCVNPDHLEIVGHSTNLSRVPLAADSIDSTVSAVLAAYSPGGVVAWWTDWLTLDPRARLLKQRALIAMSEGLFSEDAA